MARIDQRRTDVATAAGQHLFQRVVFKSSRLAWIGLDLVQLAASMASAARHHALD